MLDTHYVNPRLAAIYDLDSGWSADRDFYLNLPTSTMRILDLGCGTGLICNAYAERGHLVTGLDPSATMLALARQKTWGNKIEWIESKAQNYQADKKFDLIIMTGHAFQVLLEEEDIKATMATMANHLAEAGKIVFESRNPRIDWSQCWNYQIDLATSEGSVCESRHFMAMKNERMSFELRYRFADETLISRSELRFWSRETIEEHLHRAGLSLLNLYGHWDCSQFQEDSSLEMIFVAGAR